MTHTHDVIVIGLGVGGEEVAGTLAEAGVDVLAIERNLVGGECPYWGCIPTKMMLRAAGTLAEAARVDVLAGEAHAHADYGPVAHRIRAEATDTWNDTVAVGRLQRKGATFVRGEARFTARHEVEVDGERYVARRGVVIAAGGRPALPAIDGLDDVEFWTNREAVEAKEPPHSLIVLGGGPIGLEIGQAFSRFGSEVTVVEMAPRVLPLEEPGNSEALEQVLREQGTAVHTGVSATSIARSSDGVVVELSDQRVLEAERLLVATGRHLNVTELQLDAAGLDPSAAAIEVDENLRAADGIWGVGDITSKGAFTHVAAYQARLATADILGRPHASADYSAVPRVTFTDPEVASVGVSQEQAARSGIQVRVGSSKTASSARGWIHGPGAAHGVVKLVADSDGGVLVGASVMGPAAGEVIGLLVLAIRYRVPLEKLRELIFPYPTFVRAVEDALRDLLQG